MPSKKIVWRIAWFGLWLLVWGYMVGGIFYIWAIMIGGVVGLLGDPSSGDVFNPGLLMTIVCILPFLIGLLGMGGAVIYSFLWQIGGQEVIEANRQSLTVTRQIFSWKKSKGYSSEVISNLRVNQQSRISFDSVRKLLAQDGTIVFNCGAKTFRIGLEIDEAEAKEIISILQQYLPKQTTG